jgi:hypothetical protein
MKTNIKLALVSALTLMIAAQPAYGMQSIKEQLKTSRVARVASVVTFVGLVTGNKKLALAGACVLPIALMTPEQRMQLLGKALENWQLIACAASAAGLGYQLWKLYTIIQQENSKNEKDLSVLNNKYSTNTDQKKQPELSYVLDDTFRQDLFENTETLSQPITSPRVESISPTTPLGSPRIIPGTNVVIVDAPKESYETQVAKLALQLNTLVETNDLESCIKIKEALNQQDPQLVRKALRYNEKMLAQTARANMLTQKTVLDAYKHYKVSL